MRTLIAKLFPNAKFSERTNQGFFVIGVQSLQFADLPNFGSFGSPEEGEGLLGGEPNREPNNFGSLSNFSSPNQAVNQNQIRV